mgnify:FL=1|tara:strand:- start:2747 stop:3049 length:303 start_codon:yes stop_codon:yes gene_type:complete
MVNKNFTKNDISKFLSKKTGYSNSLSKKIIEDLIEILKKNIISNRLILKNIGSFKLINKKSRIGRNPKSQKNYKIKSRKVVIFKSSNTLSNKINKKFTNE